MLSSAANNGTLWHWQGKQLATNKVYMNFFFKMKKDGYFSRLIWVSTSGLVVITLKFINLSVSKMCAQGKTDSKKGKLIILDKI